MSILCISLRDRHLPKLVQINYGCLICTATQPSMFPSTLPTTIPSQPSVEPSLNPSLEPSLQPTKTPPDDAEPATSDFMNQMTTKNTFNISDMFTTFGMFELPNITNTGLLKDKG